MGGDIGESIGETIGGFFGGFFGRRRGGGNSDNSGLIRSLIARNEENHRRFMALMSKAKNLIKNILKY